MFKALVYELGRKLNSWAVPALRTFIILLEKQDTNREDSPREDMAAYQRSTQRTRAKSEYPPGGRAGIVAEWHQGEEFQHPSLKTKLCS